MQDQEPANEMLQRLPRQAMEQHVMGVELTSDRVPEDAGATEQVCDPLKFRYFGRLRPVFGENCHWASTSSVALNMTRDAFGFKPMPPSPQGYPPSARTQLMARAVTSPLRLGA